MPAGIWNRTSLRKLLTDQPERMADHYWVFQVQHNGEPEPFTVQDPPGYTPVLPIRHPDYQKDTIANLFLWLMNGQWPTADVHISITTGAMLAASGHRWYIYTDPPPKVDAICPLCGQVFPAWPRETPICDDCYPHAGSPILDADG